MQQLKPCQDYGSIIQQETHNHSSSNREAEENKNDKRRKKSPLNPLEKKQAESTVGSEYYVSLPSSASPYNNASISVACFRMDESDDLFSNENGCGRGNCLGNFTEQEQRELLTVYDGHGDSDRKIKSPNFITALSASIQKSSNAFLYLLGFAKNPVISSSTSVASLAPTVNTAASLQDDAIETDTSPLLEPKKSGRNSSYADVRLSMVSNFSAAYNTINISLALILMRSLHPPANNSDISICSSALIAGMILGQLGGGLLGDWMGRHAAMAAVMSLQVAAAFLSGWSGLGVANNFGWNTYIVLAGMACQNMDSSI